MTHTSKLFALLAVALVLPSDACNDPLRVSIPTRRRSARSVPARSATFPSRTAVTTPMDRGGPAKA